MGSVISPFNAWQIFRGSVTFPLRMERINQSAQKIAEYEEKFKSGRLSDQLAVELFLIEALNGE